MKSKKKTTAAQQITDSWWFKPLLAACVIFFVFVNLDLLVDLGYSPLPLLFGILASFVACSAWAGLRKARETRDYKKILIAGYAFGVVFAILAEFLILFNNCTPYGCTAYYDFPPHRYNEIIGFATGQGVTISEGLTPLESLWQFEIWPLVSWAFIAAGLVCGLIAAASAKYLTKKKKR